MCKQVKSKGAQFIGSLHICEKQKEINSGISTRVQQVFWLSQRRNAAFVLPLLLFRIWLGI